MSVNLNTPQPAPSAAKITSASSTVGWAWTQTSLGPDVQAWAPGGPTIPTGTANQIPTLDGAGGLVAGAVAVTIDPAMGTMAASSGNWQLNQDGSASLAGVTVPYEFTYKSLDALGNPQSLLGIFPSGIYIGSQSSGTNNTYIGAGTAYPLHLTTEVSNVTNPLTVNGAVNDGVTALQVNGELLLASIDTNTVPGTADRQLVMDSSTGKLARWNASGMTWILIG